MKTPLKNTDNNLQRLFREATQEQPSYTESHTKRDLLRAADASLLTRIRTSLTNIPGKYLMTFSTALVAIGLSTILLQNPELKVPVAASTPAQTVPNSLALGPAVQAPATKSGCCSTPASSQSGGVVAVDTVQIAVAPRSEMLVKTGKPSEAGTITHGTGEVWTDSLFVNKMVFHEPITCDTVRININSTGVKLNASGLVTKRKALPPIDLNSRNALEADDFLSALGIVKTADKIMFYDGSSINNTSLRYTRYLSATEDYMQVDAAGVDVKTFDPAFNAKVSFRPMFIVRSDGTVLEFSDAAIKKPGQFMLDPAPTMALYKDSCVTVVVHPDGKKPFYLLYYPTPEFLNALPRERALQVRAEQGNAEALHELQNSYKGCRYMSFCSTSNGAIEDTEILGSLSSDTRVRITLKEQRTVRVALYDIVGRMVAEIDKGSVYNPGQHIIPLQFRADNQQAPTFYLLCITTDAGEKVSQRVVLGN